ncbi:FeFe-hydrogenase_assembly protein HydF [Hexamita inflata]|uniref:FeFe-hydrogenase assembly protein HydF n=1 Tax=Hexamita inflata TaxID=28002 RepID=A0AA86RFL9_9EUKA|nr:FeFe-hydrogenase assembly protein HydF [Hexamita inflata]
MQVNRLNIVVAGRMNAGKSTFTNALTQNSTSIVDATPGTTADAKITLMEIHGLGACRIFDTAGIDELGQLGLKKRKKTLKLIQQADIVVLVNSEVSDEYKYQLIINEYARQLSSNNSLADASIYALQAEEQIKQFCVKKNKQFIEIFNDKNANGIINKLSSMSHPRFRTNVQKTDAHDLAQIIKDNTVLGSENGAEVLPKFIVDLKQNENVLLIIPLDKQSPKLRLLRPQEQTIEALLSHKLTPICFRLDLDAARGKNGLAAQQIELAALNDILDKNKPAATITDSQAMDIIKNLKTPLTTFSVMQMHLLLGQNLFKYTNESIKALETLKNKNQPKILISEACQHDRITQNCDDIGTKQIPGYLNKMFKNPQIIYSFGKDDELMDNEFDLVIHCGGCMISTQHMQSRVGGFRDKNIPVVSYGTFLSYATGGMNAVKRVLDVW